MAANQALPPNLPPRGLSRRAAAQYVGLGCTKFDELVKAGRLPKPLQFDGRRVWDRLALDQAFEAMSDPNGVRNEWDTV